MPFTLVAAVDLKTNLIAMARIKQTDLKVKTDFTLLTNAGDLKRGSRHLMF